MKAVVGNNKTTKYLKDAVVNKNLSHGYLFVGPQSVGKTMVAVEMARLLLCDDGGADSCSCPSCQKVIKLAHPDLHFIDGRESGIDEVRELAHSLDLAPYQSHYRIGIISHTQRLTIPALNSFLKTLEEPGDNTILILTAENHKTLLPTIVSRTRRVNFGTVSDRDIFEHLNKEIGIKREIAEDITSLASGCIGRAISMANQSQDATNRIKEGENFLRVYKSDSIAEKIFLAGKLASDKEGIPEKLGHLSAILRENLLNLVDNDKKQDANIVISALDSIARAEEMIMKNINAKLVVESLLLRSL